MKFFKKQNLFCVVLVLCFSLTVFSFAQEKKEEKKEPIKIGAIFSITGGASWLGEPERNTMVMYVEKINKAGGVLGRPIELIVEDTEGNETKTVNATKKLITKDNVIAIVGPSRSGSTMAIIDIPGEYKVPLISCAAAESIAVPVRKYVFKTPQKDSDAALRILEHLKKKGVKKIAIMSEASGFGDQGRLQLKKYAPEYGIAVVADDTYGPKDTDMTPQLTKIKATEAQAVVNWSIVPAQSIIPKNMKQLGMTIPLYQSHGFGNPKYAEACGEAGEGIIFPAGRLLACDTLPDDHPQKKVLMNYKKEYEERFKDSVSTFGGHAYDALFIIVEAIKKAGVVDKDKIRDEIEKTKGFIGTGGIFNYSPEDHTGLQKDAFEMLTIKNGKFVVLQD
ncbi:ABC transporter substrate-binding protein [Candidatus Sumerlaeota bacterium]|nr:ABC transporter substrate-binding protein [Candidatus Sumerlaeota bacterium]